MYTVCLQMYACDLVICECVVIGVEQFSPVICTLTYVVCVPPYLSFYCTEVLVLYVHVCILTLSMCCTSPALWYTEDYITV